jgi:hypothetical protein
VDAVDRTGAAPLPAWKAVPDGVTVNLGGDDIRTVRRATTQAVRSIKAHRPRKARTTHVS